MLFWLKETLADIEPGAYISCEGTIVRYTTLVQVAKRKLGKLFETGKMKTKILYWLVAGYTSNYVTRIH